MLFARRWENEAATTNRRPRLPMIDGVGMARDGRSVRSLESQTPKAFCILHIRQLGERAATRSLVAMYRAGLKSGS